MLAIALELAAENPAYEDIASKFFEHFVHITHAMNDLGGEGIELWDEEDGFYYDVLHLPDNQHLQLKVRSMVGLIPLFGVLTLEPEMIDRLPGFKRRMQWFLDHHLEFPEHLDSVEVPGRGTRRLLSLVRRDRLQRVLARMLDESEFLSPGGVRALSKFHAEHPYVFRTRDREYRVAYEPAESRDGDFGGNSNWRGPVWFPVNYLLIEALQRFHYFYGDTFKVECPTGSGRMENLWSVAHDLSRRLIALFLPDSDGHRPLHDRSERFRTDPHWKDLVLFPEYFHGDTGAGLGAGHQTGWTALVAKLIEQCGGDAGGS
jgi:hypothetical protein